MAVETPKSAETEVGHPGSQGAGGRRMVLGTNVLVGTALVIGIVVVLQLLAYQIPKRWDMTRSGVNSLGEGTENLLHALTTNVTLTSLYFETDRETEDQPRYRRAVDDLIGLYAATNRGKVSAQWINPLKDHEAFKKLVSRLREKPVFSGSIQQYKERIEAYTRPEDGLDARMRALLQGELEGIRGLGGGMGDNAVQQSIQRVEMFLTQWTDELDATRGAVDTRILPADPQYALAINEVKTLYRGLMESLENIAAFGAGEIARNPNLPAATAEYFSGCESRCAEVIAAIDAEQTKLQALDPLEADNLLRQIVPTSNAIVVETDEDVRVVDFSSVWPPLDPSAGGPQVTFWNRAFKGEEKVTSAILRAAHKEQTAVIFVRYAGDPLLRASFMPGQPQGAYVALKQQLEDANFVVAEWDLKTSDTPPELDPAPTRTIFIVLKPTAPSRDPMGRPSQDPPFTDRHKEKLLSALGDSGRALFIAGWAPGPFGPIPSTYEYGTYLKDTWGIEVDTSALLTQFGSIAPGRFHITRRDFYAMQDLDVTDHDIVSGPQMRWSLPWCAPLNLNDTPPKGVEHFLLMTKAKREGAWGVRNIQTYEKQIAEQNYLTRDDGDLEGPYTLAVAATKGEAKTVVVSSRAFAEDTVAFARELAMSSTGFQLRLRNPGNVTLLVNTLHWLNDNTQFLNIGSPVELAILKVDSPSTIKMVRALTIVIWPALALFGGVTVWWVRRR
ncbi:MAG: Gldg family protein [Planctomycetes bacterium]|nr:Gldg family protein [Planctomycetota bacterium]